jgi:hypothetical protein
MDIFKQIIYFEFSQKLNFVFKFQNLASNFKSSWSKSSWFKFWIPQTKLQILYF